MNAEAMDEPTDERWQQAIHRARVKKSIAILLADLDVDDRVTVLADLMIDIRIAVNTEKASVPEGRRVSGHIPEPLVVTRVTTPKRAKKEAPPADPPEAHLPESVGDENDEAELQEVLKFLQECPGSSMSEIATATGIDGRLPRWKRQRLMSRADGNGKIRKVGNGPSMRYFPGKKSR